MFPLFMRIFMTKGIFVTATGTDIGKTYVCGLLLKKMINNNCSCGYYKPVLSGLESKNGILIPGDVENVFKVAGVETNPNDYVSYSFEQAVSPHLAARLGDINISVDKICADFYNIAKNFDYLIVEGAGGITCPLSIDNNILLLKDVIKALNLDIIIVADAGLGTINSVLLTVEYAHKCNINIKGIVLNNYDKDNFMHVDNKSSIEKLSGVKVIATVAHNDDELCIGQEELLNMFEEI